VPVSTTSEDVVAGEQVLEQVPRPIRDSIRHVRAAIADAHATSASK
jgi:hypothetical protein